jgi:hypothetical protein
VLAGWALTLLPLAVVAALYHAELKQWPMWMVILGALVAFVPLFLYRRTVVHRLVAERAAARRAGAHPTPPGAA